MAKLGHDCGLGNGPRESLWPREGRENACAGAKRRERGKENWAGSNRPMREKEVRERRRESRAAATELGRIEGRGIDSLLSSFLFSDLIFQIHFQIRFEFI